MRRFFDHAMLIITPLLLAGMISPAVATAGVGPPGGGVQHQFTNGPFATATWFTQTAQATTLTSVAATRHPGGGTELTVSQEVETLATNSFQRDECRCIERLYVHHRRHQIDGRGRARDRPARANLQRCRMLSHHHQRLRDVGRPGSPDQRRGQ